jgi:hypothetical protein
VGKGAKTNPAQTGVNRRKSLMTNWRDPDNHVGSQAIVRQHAKA